MTVIPATTYMNRVVRKVKRQEGGSSKKQEVDTRTET